MSTINASAWAPQIKQTPRASFRSFPVNVWLFLLGLPGLVQAYQTCIQSVQLYGPTNISPIINHVAHFAQQAAQIPTATVSDLYAFCQTFGPAYQIDWYDSCELFDIKLWQGELCQ